MWVDEGGFMEEALFLNVLVPILEMMRCVLIITSTLVDMYNYLTELMQLKDPATGCLVFNVYQQTFICDRCQRSEHPEKCKHKLYEAPPHKSMAKRGIVQLLYGEKNAALMARESMGVILNSDQLCLNPKDIDIIEQHKPFDWEEAKCAPPTYVFIGCDPNAMGANHTAYVALAIIDGRPMVSNTSFINLLQLQPRYRAMSARFPL